MLGSSPCHSQAAGPVVTYYEVALIEAFLTYPCGCPALKLHTAASPQITDQ